MSLSLSVLLAAVVLAASRPFPPLPAIAAGNPRVELELERSVGLVAARSEVEEGRRRGGFCCVWRFSPVPLFSAGAEVLNAPRRGNFWVWVLNPVGAESRGRARSAFSRLPGRENFGGRWDQGELG